MEGLPARGGRSLLWRCPRIFSPMRRRELEGPKASLSKGSRTACLEEDGQLVIVDYQDRPGEKTGEELVGRHRDQLGILRLCPELKHWAFRSGNILLYSFAPCPGQCRFPSRL